jgi:sulfoquinovosidase
MRRCPPLLLVLATLGCRPSEQSFGDWFVTWDDEAASLAIHWQGREVLSLDELAVGEGSAELEFQTGSYRRTDDDPVLARGQGLEVRSRSDTPMWVAEVLGESGAMIATLSVTETTSDMLRIEVQATAAAANRARATFACSGDDVFLGGGAHPFDVDHAGEAFDLWSSEPGIGHVDVEEPSDTWYLTGTRHSTSYPSPFFLRPLDAVGLVADTRARVRVDLCASDPTQWSVEAWEGRLAMVVVPGRDALDVTERYARATGPPLVPPDWAFAPWNDAVRGQDAVREVAATLREAGAPSSVIWTEDWKGEDEGPFGYKVSDEWTADRELYPDIEDVAAELEADGFKWLAYFKPFLAEDTDAWAEAEALAIRDDEGDVYWMQGTDLQQTTVLDPTSPAAEEWAQARMLDALELGFAGWMQDFGEWVPPDSVFVGMDPVDDHNAHPSAWHALAADVVQGQDALIFTRSGWMGSGALAAVAWGGDQRTSFDVDDGYPTVVALGLGTSLAGSPFFGHDIGGYSSVGNAPSTRELWFRWCALGAFSPIMRTHHGRMTDENWQFDTDAETLSHFVRYGREHVRIFPYLRGLAARAGRRGTPLLMPPAMRYGGDWGRVDAWLLGDALLVAPVLEAGALGRTVELPPGADWYDWWTGAKVDSGEFEAPVTEIPVFVAGGSVVPTFTEIPDTLVAGTGGDLRDLVDVDDARTVRIFGGGGTFVEADGTCYRVEGRPTEAETATGTMSSGRISVGGATVVVEGTVERTYIFEVVP